MLTILAGIGLFAAGIGFGWIAWWPLSEALGKGRTPWDPANLFLDSHGKLRRLEKAHSACNLLT